MAIKQLSVFYTLLSVVLVHNAASSFECIVNDFQNYNDHIGGCVDSKVLTFNITQPWQRIPKDLIDRTNMIHTILITNATIDSIDNKEFCSWHNLNSLNAEKNNIETLTTRMLFECRLLKYLSFASNRIIEVYDDAFHGLTFLLELDLSNNRIQSLSENTFKPMTSLRTLRLNNNAIQVINSDIFNENHKLEFLDMSYNQLSVIEHAAFWHLDSLTTLDVSYNKQLKTIDLHEMDRLTNVILKGDLFDFIDVPKCVVKINAESNAISRMKFERNTLLDDLNLRNNSFRDFKKLADAIHLTHLDISNNNISEVDFSYLMSTQIQYISIVDNPLKNLDVKALTDIPTLRYIEISLNNLDAQTKTDLIKKANSAKIRISDPNLTGDSGSSFISPSIVTPDVLPSKVTTPSIPISNTDVTKDLSLIKLDERLKKLEEFENYVKNMEDNNHTNVIIF